MSFRHLSAALAAAAALALAATAPASAQVRGCRASARQERIMPSWSEKASSKRQT